MIDAASLLGFNIRRMRLERSLSFSDLDRRSWIDRSYLHRLEKGEKNPTLDKLVSLAKAFGVEVSELFAAPRHIACCATLSPAPGPCDCGCDALLKDEEKP